MPRWWPSPPPPPARNRDAPGRAAGRPARFARPAAPAIPPSRATAPAASRPSPPDQIEQGIKTDPHDVDEAPIERHHHRRALAAHRIKDQPEADQHMQRMDGGGGEIEDEEDPLRPGFRTDGSKAGAGEQALMDILGIFEALHRQEGDAQRPGE